MADANVGNRVAELAQQVLGPLVLGGSIRCVRPFGPKLALAIGDRDVPDDELRSRIDVVRVRRARLYWPVDVLPGLDGAQWALAAALNDLVQATNHELSSVLTRGRHQRLLDGVRSICEHVRPPRDVGDALCRHATFGAVLAMARTDSEVSWWTGRASFRGQPPAKRLLYWRHQRRVRVEERKVSLADMCEGLDVLREDDFRQTLSMWLGRTPLTDLATITRASPRFAWSAATLALVATAPGRALVHRALLRQPVRQAVAELGRATKEIPASLPEARAVADAFLREVGDAVRLRGLSA